MTVKEFVIDCIEQARGDDLARAKMTYQGCSAEAMQKEYFESGRTRQQILDGHQAHSDTCDAAIKACRKFLPTELSVEDIV